MKQRVEEEEQLSEEAAEVEESPVRKGRGRRSMPPADMDIMVSSGTRLALLCLECSLGLLTCDFCVSQATKSMEKTVPLAKKMASRLTITSSWRQQAIYFPCLLVLLFIVSIVFQVAIVFVCCLFVYCCSYCVFHIIYCDEF